jgi:hypothetical protein
MRSLGEHRARGAVIKFGSKYHLVTLDAVDQFLRDKKTGPIAGIRRTTLENPKVIGGWVHVRVGSQLKSLLAAPLYECPCGNDRSTKPRVCLCPEHRPLTLLDDGG